MWHLPSQLPLIRAHFRVCNLMWSLLTGLQFSKTLTLRVIKFLRARIGPIVLIIDAFMLEKMHYLQKPLFATDYCYSISAQINKSLAVEEQSVGHFTITGQINFFFHFWSYPENFLPNEMDNCVLFMWPIEIKGFIIFQKSCNHLSTKFTQLIDKLQRNVNKHMHIFSLYSRVSTGLSN